VGSIWSAGAYQSVTTGRPAASYIASAQKAVASAPRGTLVLDSPVPIQIQNTGNGARSVLDPVRPGKLHWIDEPRGTLDGLRIFSRDGRLHPVWVYGASTGRPAPPDSCWPTRQGRIVLNFWHKPLAATVLRIGYIWGPQTPGTIFVGYGSSQQVLRVLPGLHTAFLPVSGSAPRITVSGLAGHKICIGDAEAGTALPSTSKKNQA